METINYEVGARVEKACAVCLEECGHVVVSLTKRGLISRVSCIRCGTRSTYKGPTAAADAPRAPRSSVPYDRRRTYRRGQTIMHPTYGIGEVAAIIQPNKIDVLFTDRMRRFLHAQD